MALSSILNQVIGPVMPGSSSSHTAGPYHIARVFRSMAGELPLSVAFNFEPGSSIATVYHEQGSDKALVMGVLGLDLTDPRFTEILTLCPSFGVKISFTAEHFPEACHPNSIRMTAYMRDGGKISAVADSTGGGAFLFRYLNGWKVALTGDSCSLAAEGSEDAEMSAIEKCGGAAFQCAGGRKFAIASSGFPFDAKTLNALKNSRGVGRVFNIAPVYYPIRGRQIFTSCAEMLSYASSHKMSLGEAALEYESELLKVPKADLDREMDRRLQVMLDSVELGLSDKSPGMFLLKPSAAEIMRAELEGRLALGGVLTRAAARSMAAMQVNSGQGIVCAAPTGGSAGVIPGVAATLLNDLGKSRAAVLRAMWAAGAVGWVLSTRGTFAAEVCGCQVEIGAAGAMGAAAVAEAAGGTPQQAADAAAIMFQNGMGLVCDLIQGIVEIPCHTRNASFASQAFICADLILGGYANPVGLDETIDAVCSVGHAMPASLRCTSLGGLAASPQAKAMKKLRQ